MPLALPHPPATILLRVLPCLACLLWFDATPWAALASPPLRVTSLGVALHPCGQCLDRSRAFSWGDTGYLLSAPHGQGPAFLGVALIPRLLMETMMGVTELPLACELERLGWVAFDVEAVVCSSDVEGDLAAALPHAGLPSMPVGTPVLMVRRGDD
jgi:hypothetical protein